MLKMMRSKGEEDHDVENDDVEEEEENDDVEDDDVEEEDRFPDSHTLCEPAQLKCTSTLHKSHFAQ